MDICYLDVFYRVGTAVNKLLAASNMRKFLNKIRKFKCERTFKFEDVEKHFNAVCKSNNFTLPCELDSWHGFESNSSKALESLGKYLESKFNWRNVGYWQVQGGLYHLRVAKEGMYNLESILSEIPNMEKAASEHGVKYYVDCAPQPLLP